MKTYQILPFYRKLCACLGIPLNCGDDIVFSAESVVPHPLLRRTLKNNPSMAAILEAIILENGGIHFSLGSFENAPFIFLKPGLIQLSSVLILDPGALGAAARWGLEAHRMHKQSEMTEPQLIKIINHGNALIKQLEKTSRNCLLSTIPPSLQDEMVIETPVDQPSSELLTWLAESTRSAIKPKRPGAGYDFVELEYPIETVLVSGGDSRLRINTNMGCNRYGVPPRPRPEAIHFSSSTASAITDYGFTVCELLRRNLLSAIGRGTASEQAMKSRLVKAVGREILKLFGLDETVSDLAITPSGTDTELLALLVARSGARGRPLTNVLIAPDESGSGVPMAARGRYFDDVAATGVQVTRGTAVWPNAEIEVEEIPIRDKQGNPLPSSQINKNFLKVCRAALEAGDHLLVHTMMSSKTDLYAPTFDAVSELVAEAPDRVDVVVDACQLRVDFKALGDIVRQNWMVQVSGSKFLTGPPFSGALILPASLRTRAPAIIDDLLRSPSISSPVDWLAAWTTELPASAGTTSYGPLFRWLPALLEAKLLFELPENFRREIAAYFRDALIKRMTESKYLRPLTIARPFTISVDKTVTHSILSFVVLGKRWNRELTPLNETECKNLFELLNRDVSSLLQPLAPGEAALARQPAHIGQPVTLGSSDTAMTTVLRFVLGARFFTIVGHCDPEAREAALESEIADAERAIAKIELLASYWWRLD